MERVHFRSEIGVADTINSPLPFEVKMERLHDFQGK
jgi:hypothetical protein